MDTFTLQEVADKTGRSTDVLRKHIERGKLRVTKEGSRTVVKEDDLNAYLTSDELSTAATKVLTSSDVPREVGNMIGRLPQKVAQAILEGMPTSKKQGESAPFLKAIRDIPKNGPVNLDEDDPHFGYPVGYQHREAPRWKRKSASTWTLGPATFSWNGLGWEGGGIREGYALGDGISPANPASDRRPLAAPEKSTGAKS